jgi:hypothetical protein
VRIEIRIVIGIRVGVQVDTGVFSDVVSKRKRLVSCDIDFFAYSVSKMSPVFFKIEFQHTDFRTVYIFVVESPVEFTFIGIALIKGHDFSYRFKKL